MRRHSRRGRRGQIIAVSALVIALLMISTAAYIYELSGDVGGVDAFLLNDFMRMMESGSRHVIIGALANITNAGGVQTLVTNLARWKATVEQQYGFGTFVLDYTLRSVAPYVSGLYVNWDSDGHGVSEAYADFVLNANGNDVKMQFPFYVNVSTRLTVEGFITETAPGNKQATVTCRLYNEGQPALAKNMTFYYRESVQWIQATNNLVITNYGNGTYRATFTVETSAVALDVSARVFDLRNVLVEANVTCLQQ
jgi:hypothetical protein